MPTKSRTVTRVVADKVERYTIWDNLARHEIELREIGATDSDLDALRKAAEAVDVLERQEAVETGRNPHLEQADLGLITAPHVCANGWVIQPPSALARRWARVATVKMTDGTAPADGFSSAAVVLVSLWVLMMWPKNSDAVMRAVMVAGRLAELIPELIDAVEQDHLDSMVDDYVWLMGFGVQKKTAPAMAEYMAMLSRIRKASSDRSTAKSSPSI